MNAASSLTIRSLKSLDRQPQTKVLTAGFHPLPFAGSWEDSVAAASLATMAAMIVYLFLVG